MPVLTAAAFPDFFNTTRPQRLTNATTLVNMAQRTSYPFFRLLRGRAADDIVRGGSSIVELVKLRDVGTFRSINPGDRRAVTIGSSTANLTYQWRFYESHIGWTDAEYNLHTSGGDFVQVKRFRNVKDADSLTDHINGLDALLFAVPNRQTMDLAPAGAGGAQGAAYSIPCWITENRGSTAGRPSGTGADTWNGTANAGIGGIDPTVEPAWRNRSAFYSTDAELLAAFDRFMLDLYFQAPADAGTAMQSTGDSDVMCFTNTAGILRMKSIARAENDRTKAINDASVGKDVLWDGMPLVHVPLLDTALLGQTTANGNLTNTPYTNPRFFFTNRRHLKPVMDTASIFTPKPAMRGGIEYPDVTVVYTTTTVNLVCNARNRQGVIAPTTAEA